MGLPAFWEPHPYSLTGTLPDHVVDFLPPLIHISFKQRQDPGPEGLLIHLDEGNAFIFHQLR